MPPIAIPALRAAGERRRRRRIAFQPVLNRIVIILLRPEQPGVSLTRNAPLFWRQRRGNALVVKPIGLTNSPGKNFCEGLAETWLRCLAVSIKTQAQRLRFAGGDIQSVMNGCFSSDGGGVDGLGSPVN